MKTERGNIKKEIQDNIKKRGVKSEEEEGEREEKKRRKKQPRKNVFFSFTLQASLLSSI